MKTKIQIKSYVGELLFEYETENNSIKKTVEEAIGRGIDLWKANLQGADLWKANLHGADLRGAYLRGADLWEADLQGADIQGADLRGADLWKANLQRADLRGAYLRGAYLQEADLREANLWGANLQGADLWKANLHGADLRGAYLRGAYLRGAKYNEPIFLPDLYSLKLLPRYTKLRFWKYLIDGKSPYQNFEYKVGKTYKFSECDKDENNLCSYGGNVATLMWCLKDDLKANEFIEVEFQVKDIVAIPFATDGKFRVKKFKVIKKYTRKQVLDLLKKKMKN